MPVDATTLPEIAGLIERFGATLAILPAGPGRSPAPGHPAGGDGRGHPWGTRSSSSLLLAGIALNSVCAALILLVHSLTGVSQSFAISRWLIGGLDAIDRPTLLAYVIVIIVASLLVVRQSRQWNLLAVGEAWAATRGAHVRRALVHGYLTGSGLAATTVALTGPIGFVGLVVPHVLRARLGGDDRLLMPCSFLLGAVLLAGCDALGRAVIAPAEIPAGAITAFIGGPHLIWIVRRGAGR